MAFSQKNIKILSQVEEKKETKITMWSDLCTSAL